MPSVLENIHRPTGSRVFRYDKKLDNSGCMQLLPLKVRVDRIGQHVIRARLFLDLWFYFEGENTRSKIIGTMEEYNEFFRFTPHACLTTYVIYMAGVFDKRKGTISLGRLIGEVETAGYLKGHDAAVIETLLARAKPIAEKVEILRHNAFAHRSAHNLYNDVFKLAAVTSDEFHELTEIALTATNRLLLACGLQEQYFTELPRAAAVEMMKTLASRAG